MVLLVDPKHKKMRWFCFLFFILSLFFIAPSMIKDDYFLVFSFNKYVKAMVASDCKTGSDFTELECWQPFDVVTSFELIRSRSYIFFKNLSVSYIFFIEVFFIFNFTDLSPPI